MHKMYHKQCKSIEYMSAACVKGKCSPSLGLCILQHSLGLELAFTQLECIAVLFL